MSSEETYSYSSSWPDLSGVYGQIGGLRDRCAQAERGVAQCRGEVRELARAQRLQAGEIAACRDDQARLSHGLEETRGVVRTLNSRQVQQQEQLGRLEQGLDQTDRCVSRVTRGQVVLQHEMRCVQVGQERLEQRSNFLEQNLSDLSGRHDSLERSFHVQHRETNHSLKAVGRHLQSLNSDQQDLRSNLTAHRDHTQSRLEQVGGELASLGAGQHELRREVTRVHAHLQNEFQVANQHLAALDLGQDQLRDSLQRHQAQTKREFEQVNRCIETLAEGQESLQRELERQAETVAQELKCLRAADQRLETEIQRCNQGIAELRQVNLQLQAQIRDTNASLSDLSQYTTEFHRQFDGFRYLVEERCTEARELLRQQQLTTQQARQFAFDNLGLVDERTAARFGEGEEYDGIRKLVNQADAYAAQNPQGSLAMYVTAAERALTLWNKTRRAEDEQIEREQRIRNRLDNVTQFLETWRGNEIVVYYRHEELKSLSETARGLTDNLGSLSGAAARDLLERTAAAQFAADELHEQAKRREEHDYPDLINKHEMRERFCEGIIQAVEDAFQRLNLDIDHRVRPQITNSENRNSPLHFERGSGSRKFVAEVDLNGTCHCWWDGYQGREHFDNIEALQDVLAGDKSLHISMAAGPTYRGEPDFKEPPPPPEIKRKAKEDDSPVKRPPINDQHSMPEQKPVTHERNS